MEPPWNADRQVNARNRFAREILRCKNHQIRAAPIEIVSKAFVFAGAERHGSKHGFARCAVLETVLLDRAASRSCLSRTLPDAWPVTVAGATTLSCSCLNAVVYP
jgi:hypothetical protein